MIIPTKEDCYRLMHEMKMLDHIAAHSFQVCRVALLITDNLNTKDKFLNRNLVMSSAILHDITKTRSIETGEMHAETGGIFLKEKGYPEVSDIVRQHVRLDNFSENTPVNEAEIVNYADNRVLHDRIATLEERMNYIVERYGVSPELKKKLQEIWNVSIALERKIFNNIPFHPDLLVQQLKLVDASSEIKEHRDGILCSIL